MIKLNKNTKKAEQLINNYFKATNCGNLYEVYNNPSNNKHRAMRYCVDLLCKMDGSGATIPTYNTNIFTFAFTIDNGDKLIYITPKNEYIIEL